MSSRSIPHVLLIMLILISPTMLLGRAYSQAYVPMDFTIGVNPSSGTVLAGGMVSATVTVTMVSGTAEMVYLSASGQPPGSTVTFNPPSGIPPLICTGIVAMICWRAPFNSTMTVTTSQNTPQGSYSIIITGRTNSTFRSTTYMLQVNPPYDYSITLTPSSATLLQGGALNVSVSVVPRYGLQMPVTLSAQGVPQGVSAVFSPPGGIPPFNSIMTFTASQQAKEGTYAIRVSAVSELVAREAFFTLTISSPPFDFTISVSPSSGIISGCQEVGQSSTTVSIKTIQGIPEAVTLSVSNLPPETTASFSQTSGVPNSGPNQDTFNSTLYVKTSRTTPAGSYRLTVIATSPKISHTSYYDLVVSQPFNFTMTLDKTDITLIQGERRDLALTIDLVCGVSQNVALSVRGQPKDVDIIFNPQQLMPPAKSAIIISASTKAQPGQYLLTISGVSGEIEKTVDLRLTIISAELEISIIPQKIEIKPGESASATVMIKGAVDQATLRIGDVPAGLKVALEPEVGKPPFNSSMLIQSLPTVSPGAYTIRVIGVYQDIVREAALDIIVKAPFDFSLSIEPSSSRILQGGSVEATVSVELVSGETRPVEIRAIPPPAVQSQIEVSLSQQSGNPPFKTLLRVRTAVNTPAADYVIKIEGLSDNIHHQLEFTLTVLARFEFSVTVEPELITIVKGEEAEATVHVNLITGAAESVSLTATNLPQGISTKFEPGSSILPYSSKMTILISPEASAGVYKIDIVAEGKHASRHVILTISIIEPPFEFKVELDPTSLSIEQDSSASASVSVVLVRGVSQTVSLKAEGMPAESIVSFTPSTGEPPFSSTVNITVSEDVPVANYSITVTAYSKEASSSATILLQTTLKTVFIIAEVSPGIAPLLADGTTYTPDQLPTQFKWRVGETHTLSVPERVEGVTGIRYAFASWSDGDTSNVKVISPVSSIKLAALYNAEYLLTITSPYGEVVGSGWYLSGKTAEFSIEKSVSGGFGVTYLFEGWIGDWNGSDASGGIFMDGPKHLTAKWRVDNSVYLATTGAATAAGLTGGTAAVQQVRRVKIKKMKLKAKPALKWSMESSKKIRFNGYGQITNIFFNEGKAVARKLEVRLDGPEDLRFPRVLKVADIPPNQYEKLAIGLKHVGQKIGEEYSLPITLQGEKIRTQTASVQIRIEPVNVGVFRLNGIVPWFGMLRFQSQPLINFEDVPSFSTLVASPSQLKDDELDLLLSYINSGGGLVLVNTIGSDQLDLGTWSKIAQVFNIEDAKLVEVESILGIKVLDDSHTILGLWRKGDVFRIPSHEGFALTGRIRLANVLAEALVKVKGVEKMSAVEGIIVEHYGQGRIVHFNIPVSMSMGAVSYLFERALLWTSRFE